MRQSLIRTTITLLILGLMSWQPANGAEDTARVLELKEKLALATRMLVMEGLIGSSGHVSVRIPGTDQVLIGSRDVSRAILQAEDVVTVDLRSNQLGGTRIAPREVEIHTGIYRARPDVMAVVHSHPIHSLAFSITGKPILPVTVHGAIFGDGVPLMDYVGHINTRELGDQLGQTLGDKNAALLKMHGAAVAAPTLEEAFVWALHLEENAEKQLWAEATGTVHAMTQEDIERCISQAFGSASILKRWEYYKDKERRQVLR